MGSSKHLVCDMTISMLIFCILGIFGAPLTQIFILIACKHFFWVIGIYVDDCVIASNDLAYLDFLKVFWQKALPCETNDNIEYGQTCKIFFLSQGEYIFTNLHKFHMETCKPIVTPLLARIHYTKDMMSFTYVE
jgi:hypothetical protein